MGELKASFKSFLGPPGQLRPPLPITLLSRSPPSAGSLREVPQTEQGTGAPRPAFPSSTPPLLLRRDVALVIRPRGVRGDVAARLPSFRLVLHLPTTPRRDQRRGAWLGAQACPPVL